MHYWTFKNNIVKFRHFFPEERLWLRGDIIEFTRGNITFWPKKTKNLNPPWKILFSGGKDLPPWHTLYPTPKKLFKHKNILSTIGWLINLSSEQFFPNWLKKCTGWDMSSEHFVRIVNALSNHGIWTTFQIPQYSLR